jgi:hypothetical protein
VLIARSEVHAEAVPGAGVPILLVLLHAPHQVRGEADVVQRIAVVQRIQSRVATYQLLHLLAIAVFEDVAGHLLDEFADEDVGLACGHSYSPFDDSGSIPDIGLVAEPNDKQHAHPIHCCALDDVHLLPFLDLCIA